MVDESMKSWSFFFFSSRRRHTRYWRDWSSDVCSSDLHAALLAGQRPGTGTGRRADGGRGRSGSDGGPERGAAGGAAGRPPRTEGGRVGERGRSWGWPAFLKKKKIKYTHHIPLPTSPIH